MFQNRNLLNSPLILSTIMKKIAVIGNGSWATALIKIMSDSNAPVTIQWALRKEEDVNFIHTYGHNPRYLADVRLNFDKLTINNNLVETVKGADVVLIAVPSAFVHSVLSELDRDAFKDKIILSAVKGVIPETHQIISHYLQDSWGVKKENIAAVSGPCHAEEVAMEKLSFLTVASSDDNTAQGLAEILTCHYIHCKTTSDIDGIEYSSVLKNIYAIACGICHSLGYGDNFQAVLVSSASREIERFLDASHQTHRDVKENAYLGDLLVTAYSQFSRNRTFGAMLGKGYNVKSAQMEMNMIAEGYYATKTMHDINEEVKADMPILNAVFDIIYNHASTKRTMAGITEQLV